MDKNQEKETPVLEEKEKSTKKRKRGRKPSKEKELTAKMEELTIELNEAKEKYLRLFAEFDNHKKRTLREKLELMRNAAEDTLSSLLPVLDDFDRAKKSAEDEKTDEVFSEGVSLVYQKLYQVLLNMGLKEMDSNGQDFDSEFHEAITEIPVPDASMKGKVVDTVEKGYMLNEKIIRYAKVVVGK